jgi:hypothetical protein
VIVCPSDPQKSECNNFQMQDIWWIHRFSDHLQGFCSFFVMCRECLLQEVLTLLCTLLSNSLHSSKVLNLLTVNEESIRLSFTVMNRLISRGQKRSLDMVELAMDLRKYFSAGLQEFQENGN